jgi:hypothetical protein
VESVAPLGDLDLFTFTLASSERVIVQVTGTGTDPCLRILTGASAPPVAGGTDCNGGFTAGLDVVLAAGTYFVEVSDFNDNQTGSYTLLLQKPAP